MDTIDRLYAQSTTNTSSPTPDPTYTIQSLLTIVQNERFCPELLPFNHIIPDFLNRVNVRESEIQAPPDEDIDAPDTSAQQQQAYKAIKLLELDKIRYLIAEYFRIRREKIELFAKFLLSNGNEVLLSEDERRFAEKYLQLETNFYKRGFQEAMTDEFWSSPEYEQIQASRQPDLRQFVFVKVPDNVGSVEMQMPNEPSKQVSIVAGEVYVFSYMTVRELLREGKIVLI